MTDDIRITSLLLVEERLFEAEYFASRLEKIDDGEVGYELNAFLSAARSVTFLLQKEMKRVPNFSTWWEERRRLLADDAVARFFLELRNFSQKEGRVSLVGSYRRHGKTSWRLAGNAKPVPPALLNRDLADCCHEHTAGLARLVLDFANKFPFHSCPRRALTPDGVAELRLSIEDIERMLGLSAGWIAAGEAPRLDLILPLLSRYVDGVDFEALNRLASWTVGPIPKPVGSSAIVSESLVGAVVRSLEASRQGGSMEPSDRQKNADRSK